MPRIVLPSAAATALLAMTLAPGSAAAFPEDCAYGVNAHQVSNDALDLAADAGIAWVRFDMNWHQFEPSPGSFNWTQADRFIDHATANGQHVFVTIAYTPQWAVGAACNDADPDWINWCHNAHPSPASTWTDFVTAAVNRYGGTVKHWGMWNEPNLGGFYRGTRDQYTNEILIPGSDAVHAACADCQVLGPELANLRGSNWDSDEGICAFDECIFNGWNYSLGEVLADAGPWIDIITHHRYGEPATEWWQEAVDGEFVLTVQVINGLKELTDLHAPGKEVWITEFGLESEPFGPHSNAYAAEQLTELYEGLPMVQAGTYPSTAGSAWPELTKLFWYDLVDDPGGYSWGLLDSAEAIKPPWTAYSDVITAAGGCPEPGDDDDATPVDDDDTTPVDDDDTTPADDDDDTTPPGDDDDDDDTTPPDDDDSEPVEDDDDVTETDDDDATEAPAAGDGIAVGCGCAASVSGRPAPLGGLLLAVGAAAVGRRRRPQARIE